MKSVFVYYLHRSSKLNIRSYFDVKQHMNLVQNFIVFQCPPGIRCVFLDTYIAVQDELICRLTSHTSALTSLVSWEVVRGPMTKWTRGVGRKDDPNIARVRLPWRRCAFIACVSLWSTSWLFLAPNTGKGCGVHASVCLWLAVDAGKEERPVFTRFFAKKQDIFFSAV